MITREIMFEPLLEALPGFRPQWEAFVAYWTENPPELRDYPGALPNYILLGDLAEHLAELLVAGREAEVVAALAVCERWIVEGDEYVDNAAIAGLLEDFEGATRRRGIPAERIGPMLGPNSRRWWEQDTRTGAWANRPPPPQPVFDLKLPEDVERRLDERARRAGRQRGRYVREIGLDQIMDD